MAASPAADAVVALAAAALLAPTSEATAAAGGASAGADPSALRQLLDAVGPDLPPDLVATPTPSTTAPDAPAMRFNYDAGHDGRVSVPGSDGGSVDLRWALRRRAPWAALTGRLAFTTAPVGAGPDTGAGGEVAFFSPGLNTLHQSVTWDKTSSVDRVVHYARLLGDGWSLAQLHCGTLMDQGDSPIRLAGAPPLLFSALNAVEAALVASGVANVPRLADADAETAFLPSRARDAVQTVLSTLNTIDTRLKAAYRLLMAAAAGEPLPSSAGLAAVPPAPRLVLITYSRSTVEVAAAARAFLSAHPRATRAAVAARLRARLLIVTIGACARSYPRGLAYLHVSSTADELTALFGVSADRPFGAGGDGAAFVHLPSPFFEGELEAHNFATLICPHVAARAAVHGVVGWWGVYEAVVAGRFGAPADMEALTRAAMVVSGSERFLFAPDATWASVGVTGLPSRDAALRLLRARVPGAWSAALPAIFPAA